MFDPSRQMHEGEESSRRRGKKAKAEDGESKRRKLTVEQVQKLEMNFDEERKLDSGRKMSLACELGLEPKQVAVWFRNRRAKWKIKQLENENSKMKRELEQAREQLQMLPTESSKGESPSSSSSTKNYHPSFAEYWDVMDYWTK